MTRVIGIDPGTVSFDLCGLEDGNVFLDSSVPTAEVIDQPDRFIDRLRHTMPVDLIAGPSGYGLPLISIDRLTDRDIAHAYLPRDSGKPEGIGGLRRLVAALQRAQLPVIFTPGVVHLPTVPAYRKANRLDMGTADKVCAAVLAIHDQATRLALDYAETSFVLLELGRAFSAVLVVRNGRIVDGMGGSSGPMGYRALGAMDGELAYRLGRFSKDVLFSGGAAYLAGSPDLPAEELGGRSENVACDARDAFIEGLTKAAAAQRALVPEAREIVLSGPLAKIEWVASRLREALSWFAPVQPLNGFAETAKEAAQGAALLADGLADGSRRDLVDVMQIRNASGTVFDHLFVSGSERIARDRSD